MITPGKKFQQVKLFITIAAAAVVAGLTAMAVSYEVSYRGRVYPHVSAGGTPLSGKTLNEAVRLLTERAAQLATKQPALTIRQGANEWHILKASIKFTYSAEVVANQALQIGRSDNWQADQMRKWQSWRREVKLPWAYQYDDELMEAAVASIAAEVDVPPVEAGIEMVDKPLADGSYVVINDGEPGQTLLQEELIAKFKENLAWGRDEELNLPIKISGTEITEEEKVRTKARAESLLGKSLSLTAGDQQWTIPAKELVSFISFKDGFAKEKTAKYVATLAKAIDRPPQNAAFAYTGGRVTEFRPAKDGLTVIQEETVNNLLTALTALEAGEGKTVTATAAVGRQAAQISLASINNLGIRELLGKGTSSYKGSIEGRVHNVALSAQRLSGALVAPGEVLSFNQAVGEIAAATGYKPAYVIRSGATVLDDGGGVCQTSTTLFRAALNAGLPVLERRAHSYRVGYYEQNAKPGLDATVYAPSADLKLKNDTAAYILIQAYANSAAKTLTVEIYGTADGRQATIANHKVWDIVPAPPPRWQDDPSLPAGTTKQVEYAAAGAKAKFDYKVTRNGETLTAKTFHSQFIPWQAVYLKGVR